MVEGGPRLLVRLWVGETTPASTTAIRDVLIAVWYKSLLHSSRVAGEGWVVPVRVWITMTKLDLGKASGSGMDLI